MLEGKTANNIVDRYHRIITGDQNQIKIGGDFTTAEVTFAIVGSGSVGTSVAILFDSPAGISTLVNVSSPSEPKTVNVVLYKGASYALIISETQAINTTGDIEYDANEDMLIITGPGTITYTV